MLNLIPRLCAASLAALTSLAPLAAEAACPRSPVADTGPVHPGAAWSQVLRRVPDAIGQCGARASSRGCSFRAEGLTYEIFNGRLSSLRIPASGHRLPYGVSPRATAGQTERRLRAAGLQVWNNGDNVSILCRGGQGELSYNFDRRGRMSFLLERPGNGGG